MFGSTSGDFFQQARAGRNRNHWTAGIQHSIHRCRDLPIWPGRQKTSRNVFSCSECLDCRIVFTIIIYIDCIIGPSRSNGFQKDGQVFKASFLFLQRLGRTASLQQDLVLADSRLLRCHFHSFQSPLESSCRTTIALDYQDLHPHMIWLLREFNYINLRVSARPFLFRVKVISYDPRLGKFPIASSSTRSRTSSAEQQFQ